MKAICLTVSLYDINEHAQKFMKSIGATYQLAIPQSLFDCWQFYMCEYDPEKLPSFVKVNNDIKPETRIGNGLSPTNAAIIAEWMRENGFGATRGGRP